MEMGGEGKIAGEYGLNYFSPDISCIVCIYHVHVHFGSKFS